MLIIIGDSNILIIMLYIWMYDFYAFIMRFAGICYFWNSCFKLLSFFSIRTVLFLINKINRTVGLFSSVLMYFKTDFKLLSPVTQLFISGIHLANSLCFLTLGPYSTHSIFFKENGVSEDSLWVLLFFL